MRLTFGKYLLISPAFCCGSSHFATLVQNESFSLLKEVGLVKEVTPADEPSTPIVATEIALGGHSSSTTVASSLNSVDKTVTSIDCWVHRMAKQLSTLEAERKRQMNSLTQVLNSILEHYQQLQAHLMASGTLLIDSFEEQPDLQMSLQKLREKVALFMDLCAETFTPFPHTYSGKDLIPQPIHGFISHVHQCPDEFDCACGEAHPSGYLCDKIYQCSLCGKEHLKGNSCPDAPIEEPAEDWIEGGLLVEETKTLALEEPTEATVLQSRGEALSTFDLNGQPLTLSGAQGATFSGLLKDSGEGSLTLTGNEQNLDTDEGSSVSSISVEGGVMTLGAKRKGVLKTNSLKVGSQGTFSLGTTGSGEDKDTSVSGDLSVQNLSVDGTFNVNKTDSFVAESLTGTGDINLAEGSLMTLALQDDGEFEGTLSGTGTVAFTADHSVTFALPQRASFSGTLEVGENVTLLPSVSDSPEEPDQTEDPNAVCIATGETYTLTEDKTVSYLKSDPESGATLNLQDYQLTLEGGDNPTFYGNITHNNNSWRGNLVLTGNKQNLDTAEGASISQLIVKAGTLTVGANSSGSLTTWDKFIVEPDGVFILGTEDAAQGKLITWNNAVVNGQVKLLNGLMTVHGGSGVFQALEGKGTIFVGEQATLAFDLMAENSLTFDVSITGRGTVTFDAQGAFTFTWPKRSLFEGTVKVAENVTLLLPVSGSTEDPNVIYIAAGETYTLTEDKTFQCLTSDLDSGATLNLQTHQLTLEGGDNPTFYGSLNGGSTTLRGSIALTGNQQNLDTVSGSGIGQLNVTAGTLTIGANQNGVLSSYGFNVGPEGVVILGTEGGAKGFLNTKSYVSIAGQVNILNGTLASRSGGDADSYFTCTGSIFVGEQATFALDLAYQNYTYDEERWNYTFDGQLTGPGTVSLTASYPVTITWPQRALFTGTLNKDDTVTIVEG